MKLIEILQKSIEKNQLSNAFCINNTYYTYKNFAQIISNVRYSLQESTKETNLHIGLITNDDIETYASIMALWLEGKAYVPINPETPISRNNSIIEQAGISTILDSSKTTGAFDHLTLRTSGLKNENINLSAKTFPKENLAYILFTSGTTGIPKGVPISFFNLSEFIQAFWDLNFNLNDEDRCLQMFELTFDMSVFSFLPPLLKGACVYTIPKDKIKYSYIFELMDDYELTFVSMVPSILHYLRPYFSEINCPNLRVSVFAGEALPLDIVEEWSKCVPNAAIANAYGPTECTIVCTNYTYTSLGDLKSYKGILSIGKDMLNTKTIIIDETMEEVSTGESGELCLSSTQLSLGYWKNEEKDKEVFFFKNMNDKKTRFYKTGDLCRKDSEGNIFYLGRIDFQAKIQGFRVELAEIEHHVRVYLKKTNTVALAFTNSINNTEIGLVLESNKFDTNPLLAYLKTMLPSYMIPTKIEFTEIFPMNINGKTDRKKLLELF
ncbi:amino acid adenylation domain-containing protein [Mariniflexile sp. AS56]|uniref:amino acid adenylation domain-containing protein n=1 Tax=Mariniflexile sp. AS56 TaxID=3063957 RepID=UPI0026EBD545|nr:amino acid adenylation domain-containing protein [Mariniflexile sp. AS56]MDO7171364.1 amino acid adenylation domain-containing protein [Mariniflexile sp. AS56]